MTRAQQCNVPPPGWRCTRQAGHDGPCAAIEALPWWRPPFPAIEAAKVRFADVWDALFGKLEVFFKVEYDGSWFICEARDVRDWVCEGGPAIYTVTEVRMTRRQFNNLPEFAGF
ncbi:hypothetical protein [Piscinibacter gummiphilus]|uniref:Uncharacterized protein n=1 Tax=Piscinibacter gummiphilus TaxID=946333 RepID=A0ABZ0CNE5_9BURK|nr:hypothetical protein [Piscinibacter gummiphilus]WOB06517.1 hypothetical protein RXV79_16465 [Piscinibacter gummiphilus]